MSEKQPPRRIEGATYVASVPKGERVLAMSRIGREIYVYTERSAYRVDIEGCRLVDQAAEARDA